MQTWLNPSVEFQLRQLMCHPYWGIQAIWISCLPKTQKKQKMATLHIRWSQDPEEETTTITQLQTMLRWIGIIPRNREATLPFGMYGYTSKRSVGVIQNPRSRNKFRCTAMLIISTWSTCIKNVNIKSKYSTWLILQSFSYVNCSAKER